MSNFINDIEPNISVMNKIGYSSKPQNKKNATIVQQRLSSIVIAAYDNNMFQIAGLDFDGKKLVHFTSHKGDDSLEFWFGEDWKSKVVKVQRIGRPQEQVDLNDVA